MDQAQKLIDELVLDEACVKHAYKDSRGYWTIGIGRLIDERLGGGITDVEARYLLANDIRRTDAEVDSAFPWSKGMTGARKRALLNMAFNLGVPRLRQFKTMLMALEAGDWGLASAEALDSEWARQVGNRALRIARQFSGGGE